mmetsp:Transcript_85302/g.138322  ORF Transcript_85302/g.138322 Transcript_85302/m.138322 type:complete len:240 (-) Transcript_85302:577-1296(-)
MNANSSRLALVFAQHLADFLHVGVFGAKFRFHFPERRSQRLHDALLAIRPPTRERCKRRRQCMRVSPRVRRGLVMIFRRRLATARTHLRYRAAVHCRILLLIVLCRCRSLGRHGFSSLEFGVFNENIVEKDAHRIEKEGGARAVVVAPKRNDILVTAVSLIEMLRMVCQHKVVAISVRKQRGNKTLIRSLLGIHISNIKISLFLYRFAKHGNGAVYQYLWHLDLLHVLVCQLIHDLGER